MQSAGSRSGDVVEIQAIVRLISMQFFKTTILVVAVHLAFIFLMLVFVFIPYGDDARAYRLWNKCNSFQEADMLAVEDFNNGLRQLTFGGFRNATDFRTIRDSILFADYKVTTTYMGCVGPRDEYWRYTQTMISLLGLVHGKDFLVSAEKRAREKL